LRKNSNERNRTALYAVEAGIDRYQKSKKGSSLSKLHIRQGNIILQQAPPFICSAEFAMLFRSTSYDSRMFIFDVVSVLRLKRRYALFSAVLSERRERPGSQPAHMRSFLIAYGFLKS
jgi:hypothetical protein